MNTDKFVYDGIAMVVVGDNDDFRQIEVGSHFLGPDGHRIIITDVETAKRYHHLVSEPLYVFNK